MRRWLWQRNHNIASFDDEERRPVSRGGTKKSIDSSPPPSDVEVG